MRSNPLTHPARRSRSPRTALAFSTALLTALAATLLSVAGSNAAGATGPSRCKIVIVGAPWHIRGSGSGHNYTIAAEGMPCASARRSVVRFTQQRSTHLGQTLRGPSGFQCRSFSEAASGDDHVYSGTCLHPPHNIPFFEWTPKT